MIFGRKIYIIVNLSAFFFIIFLCLYTLMKDECYCPETDKFESKQFKIRGRKTFKYKHKLAVLVPFRDRFNELLEFAPHLTSFLEQQLVDHQIYVLNQIDNYRFNRASLINVGFKYAKNECDYIAMHDVDLLPLNNELKYFYPQTGVLHISSPSLHPKYDYPTFVGGILLVKRDDFEYVDGMSNRYWGWGLEDDEFYGRLKDAKIEIIRPVNITTGKENTFRHVHDRNIRERDMQKCFNQREITRKRDLVTGLHDVSYKIQSVQQLKIDNAHLKVLNILLKCDRNLTPWCTCDPLLSKGKQQSTQNAAKL